MTLVPARERFISQTHSRVNEGVVKDGWQKEEKENPSRGGKTDQTVNIAHH